MGTWRNRNCYSGYEEHNSNGTTQTFTTRYTVRDTQKPNAKFKTQGVEIEARRTGGWTREDLLKFIDSDLQDNWSFAKKIFGSKRQIIVEFIRLQEETPGNTWAYVDIYDEAGNQYGEYVEFKIVDTQRPTGTVKSDITIEARRSGNLSQTELRGFMTTMSDNWTLPENMKVYLVIMLEEQGYQLRDLNLVQ